MIKNTLTNGLIVELNGAIEKEISINDSIIVLFMKPGGGTQSQNIMSFDKTGQLLWVVESMALGANDNPYMSLEPIDQKSFKAATWAGDRDVILSVETGKKLGMAD